MTNLFSLLHYVATPVLEVWLYTLLRSINQKQSSPLHFSFDLSNDTFSHCTWQSWSNSNQMFFFPLPASLHVSADVNFTSGKQHKHRISHFKSKTAKVRGLSAAASISLLWCTIYLYVCMRCIALHCTYVPHGPIICVTMLKVDPVTVLLGRFPAHWETSSTGDKHKASCYHFRANLKHTLLTFYLCADSLTWSCCYQYKRLVWYKYFCYAVYGINKEGGAENSSKMTSFSQVDIKTVCCTWVKWL